MKPNSFQVSLSESCCLRTARAFSLMATTYPETCEAASSLTSSSFILCSAIFYPLPFLVLQPSVIPLSSPQTGSIYSCSSSLKLLCLQLPVELASQSGPFRQVMRNHPTGIAIQGRTCHPAAVQLCVAQQRGSCSSNCSCKPNHK